MERLIKNEILPYLDFMDLNICVGCIKGKTSKTYKEKSYKKHSASWNCAYYICGPFDVISFGKEWYFITIIDNYSHYGYVYLLPEISQAMNAIEIY